VGLLAGSSSEISRAGTLVPFMIVARELWQGRIFAVNRTFRFTSFVHHSGGPVMLDGCRAPICWSTS
jgi:hypothetical protein